MTVIVTFEFLRHFCAPIYVSIFLDISEIYSPCIVSLPVITCQQQTPSRQLTAIRGNSSQYDVARIPIDWCCFFLARIRREIIAHKIEREPIIAFTQKFRRLIRRVLAYVPVRQELLRVTPRDPSIIPLRRLYHGQSQTRKRERWRNKEIANFIMRFDIQEIPASNRYVTRVR